MQLQLLRMACITCCCIFMLIALTSGAESPLITEPGDEVLYGVVGHPLLVPCVLREDQAIKIWNIAGDPNTPITTLSTHDITLFPEFSKDYRLIQDETNFSLLIRNVQIDQPPLYCVVANPDNYKSSISRIKISGRNSYFTFCIPKLHRTETYILHTYFKVIFKL